MDTQTHTYIYTALEWWTFVQHIRHFTINSSVYASGSIFIESFIHSYIEIPSQMWIPPSLCVSECIERRQCKTALWRAMLLYEMKRHIDTIDRYTLTACFRSQPARTYIFKENNGLFHYGLRFSNSLNTIRYIHYIYECVHDVRFKEPINFRQKMASNFLILTMATWCCHAAFTATHVHTLPYVLLLFATFCRKTLPFLYILSFLRSFIRFTFNKFNFLQNTSPWSYKSRGETNKKGRLPWS